MADVKITDLVALAAAAASGDLLEVTDVSGPNVSRKATVAEIVNKAVMQAAGAAFDTDFSAANSILLATTANTPAVLAFAASTILGRGASGNAAALTAAQVRTLLGIEAGATADQTNAEIKTAYEANADTNEFSDAEQTKLSGIATGANLYVHPNHTGDVTSVNDGATTIANNAVTLAKMADMATASLIGASMLMSVSRRPSVI